MKEYDQRRRERVYEQLGMSAGAANNKLRKNLLFSCVRKLKGNFCYKCGEEIETVDEFSIEHKLPWEGRDAELFWDLDNIAFSHLKCNRPVVQKSGTPRKEGLEGTAWCSRCQNFRDVSHFHRNRSRWNGYDHQCKDCNQK